MANGKGSISAEITRFPVVFKRQAKIRLKFLQILSIGYSGYEIRQVFSFFAILSWL
jgi:hypothetical protein